MRRFLLNRLADESGVSGTGYVAEGVEFGDGKVVLHWRESCSVGIYDSVALVERIHGHGGRTVIEWVDEGLLALLPDLHMQRGPAPSIA